MYGDGQPLGSPSAAAAAARQLGDVARRKAWREVAAIFEGLRRSSAGPDHSHFNGAIAAFAASGRPSEAQTWLENMQDQGFQPDRMSFGGVVNAYARAGDLAAAEAWFRRMGETRVEADVVNYGSIINACARVGEATRAEHWLQTMLDSTLQANEVCYSSLINACAKGGEVPRAEAWFERMLEGMVQPNEVIYCSLINACAQQGEAQRAEFWLDQMNVARVSVSAVAYNTVIKTYAQRGDLAQAEQWMERLASSRVDATEVTYNSLINACAQGGSVDGAERWLLAMGEAGISASEVSYNTVINACAQKGLVERAEHWLQCMVDADVEASAVSYNTVRTACARMGETEKADMWLERMLATGASGERGVFAKLRAVGQVDEYERTGGPLKKALYSFSSHGEALVRERLERALELQWVYGYPRVPPGELQLTHGFFKYTAAMQPATARELLKLSEPLRGEERPPRRRILDVFCGSGTVLIEALVAGCDAVGCDISPLAAFVASHHCDLHRIDLEQFVLLGEEVAKAPARGVCDWQLLRDRIGTLPDSPLRNALWFVFLKAVRVAAPTARAPQAGRPADPDATLARPYLLSSVYRYAAQVRALRAASTPGGSVRVHNRDSRELKLDDPADAIVTGPPYPGVYNYVAAAKEDWEMVQLGGAIRSGTPAGRARERQSANPPFHADAFTYTGELGMKNLQSQHSAEDFAALWQRQQEEWLRAAHGNLRPGGTATLMIGNGDTEEENGIDCLQSTVDAAIVAGFDILATATIESCADTAHRTKGMLRTEHMVHLRRPTA